MAKVISLLSLSSREADEDSRSKIQRPESGWGNTVSI